MMKEPKVCFLQPEQGDSVSGGFLYNYRITQELKPLIGSCNILPLSKDLQHATPSTIDECDEKLGQLNHGHIVVIDSLALPVVDQLLQKYQHKLHFIALMHLPQFWNGSASPQQQEKEVDILRQMDAVVATSAFCKNLLIQKGVPASKTHIIEPGLDPAQYIRSYPAIPRNFLCVANVEQRKRQLDIVMALCELKQFNWTMTFCGSTAPDSKYFNQIKEVIRKNGLHERIYFTGVVDHEKISGYYQYADLFIHASEFETYGMALAEAMTWKLPVVTSNTGAIRQLVPDSIARFYEVGNTGQLKNILEELLNDPAVYNAMTQAYSYTEFAFPSWNVSALKFYELITSLSQWSDRR